MRRFRQPTHRKQRSETPDPLRTALRSYRFRLIVESSVLQFFPDAELEFILRVCESCLDHLVVMGGLLLDLLEKQPVFLGEVRTAISLYEAWLRRMT
jgi:hypothetical protein